MRDRKKNILKNKLSGAVVKPEKMSVAHLHLHRKFLGIKKQKTKKRMTMKSWEVQQQFMFRIVSTQSSELPKQRVWCYLEYKLSIISFEIWWRFHFFLIKILISDFNIVKNELTRKTYIDEKIYLAMKYTLW